ncbi:MAG: hypothetical protein LBR43_00205 [Spiroplasmataceae bacterium]|jgi:hypothetical protein|nr:hypothetical protein [Spiroplasmataceae bacterium]
MTNNDKIENISCMSCSVPIEITEYLPTQEGYCGWCCLSLHIFSEDKLKEKNQEITTNYYNYLIVNNYNPKWIDLDCLFSNNWLHFLTENQGQLSKQDGKIVKYFWNGKQVNEYWQISKGLKKSFCSSCFFKQEKINNPKEERLIILTVKGKWEKELNFCSYCTYNYTSNLLSKNSSSAKEDKILFIKEIFDWIEKELPEEVSYKINKMKEKYRKIQTKNLAWI